MARRTKKAAKKAGKKAPGVRPTPTPDRKQPIRPDRPPVRTDLPKPRLPDIRPPKPGGLPGAGFSEIDSIDADLPLLLLPVQLETIFVEQDDKPALKIRIYPDTVSIDTLTRGLRPEEMELGKAYWAAPQKQRRKLGDAMTERLGARRAAWAAEVCRPGSPHKAFRAETEEPAEPDLLPKRWIARGYRDGKAVFTQVGRPVAKGLTMSPNPDAPAWPDAPKGLPVDENMAWMVDYERAVEQGMALTVLLHERPDVLEHGLDHLIVVGVNEEIADQAAERVDRLFDAHHFTSSLEVLAQGSPTNNTDSVDSAWSADAADANLFERLIEAPDRHRKAAFDGMRLARALGLGKTSTLAKAAGAGRQEETAAEAMNQALWHAVWGEYLQNLLATRSGRSTPQSLVSFTRDWFQEHVRGGAPLPTLRIRRQPYGILPVRAAVEREEVVSKQDTLEDLLCVVRELWLSALPGVARMDPNLTDTGGQAGNSAESRLAELFMLQPHALRFVVRKLTDRRDQGPLLGYVTSLVGGFEFLLDVLSSLDLYKGFGNIYRRMQSQLESVEEQIESLEFLRDFAPEYFSAAGERQTRDNAILLVDILLDIVRDHQSRQAPLDAIEGVTTSGILHDDVDDPNIFYGLFDKDDDARVFERALVESPEPQEAEQPASYLENIAQWTLGKAPGGGPAPAAPEFPSGSPLLYQLLNPFVTTLPDGDRNGFARAVRTLAQFPADQLELRLRETLGLGSFRLDAWFTSLASKRLSDIRAKKPEGLAVGAFGWVVDLKPSAAKKDSQGFIHAPSLAHATTAAVLRSGWSAHGTAAADSPLAVNLESSRVRTARWLMGGVRQGQTPGDLLGARFERRLHDLQLDRHIDPLRRRVLESQGKQREPAGPVDGLDLRNLFVNGELNDITQGEAALRGVLRELDQWLDSVVDAGTAESVHQLAAGNIPRAAAMLRSLNTGDTRPPELLGLQTPRRGPVIENRVVALLSQTQSSWSESPRARLAPEVEAWCSALLGKPERIGCRVRTRNADGAEGELFVTMADLRISALDAVLESEVGAASAWKSRVEAFAGSGVRVAMDDPGAAEISMEEAAETAGAIQTMLGRARALAPADLAPPGESPDAAVDVAVIRARAESLLKEIEKWLGSVQNARDRRAVSDAELRRLALEGRSFGGVLATEAVAAAPQEADLRAVVQSLLNAGKRLLEAASKAIREAASVDDPVAAYRAAIERIVGRGLPIRVTFQPPPDADFAAALGHDKGLLRGDAGAPELWLWQV